MRSYDEVVATRAYVGGTTADSFALPTWIGDLTRIYDGTSGVLAATFGSAGLPETGNVLEYTQLDTNTVAFDDYNEGDDLVPGKVSLVSKTAPVNTYAGSLQLTRREIERSTVPILDHSLKAMTIAAAIRNKAKIRTAYNAAVAAQVAASADLALGATITAGTRTQWLDAVVDAATHFESIALPLDAMLVSSDVYKALLQLADSLGRPSLALVNDGENSSGTLNLPGLTGNLAGLPVKLDTGAAAGSAAFVSGDAIRNYVSGVISLSQSLVVNLSTAFSIYRYGAVATEIPAAILPLTFG